MLQLSHPNNGAEFKPLVPNCRSLNKKTAPEVAAEPGSEMVMSSASSRLSDASEVCVIDILSPKDSIFEAASLEHHKWNPVAKCPNISCVESKAFKRS